jgi:protein O-GlcNAc transferase
MSRRGPSTGKGGDLLAQGLKRDRQGDLAGAERLYREAAAADPRDARPLLGLGTLAARAGRMAEASEFFARACGLAPDNAEAHVLHGVALLEAGRHADAALALERALALAPGHIAARFRLGVARAEQGRPDDAARAFAAVLGAEPGHGAARFNLGVVHAAAGRVEDAAACYAVVLAAHPDHADAALNLADLHRRRHRYGDALEVLDAALRHHPEEAHLWASRGNVLKVLDRLDEAEAAYQRAVALAPGDAAAWGNYLLCGLYAPDRAPAETLARHRAWGDALLARTPRPAPHPNHPDPDRPIRVGYLSPDLRSHAVAAFLEPVLAHHDPAAVVPYCYASVARPDAVTERLKRFLPHWRDVLAVPDAEVAGMMRADGIDLAVDLAGHTGGSRLSVLAYRPAPVQVSYLGYPATTGLAAVDWRLTDAWADPEGAEAHGVEQLARIEGGFCCYRPPDAAPDVGPPPALTAGVVTFGSLTNTIKVNPGVVALWAEVLKAVPGSRLLLRRSTFDSAAVRDRLTGTFAAAGVAPERIDCLTGEGVDQRGYLATYGRIDIGLDTFPYAGHTTTCESLWMGVPVVTLAGGAFVARVGVSVMHMAGLEDLIAPDPAAFVAIARRLAAEPAALAELRRGLRDRVRASPLCDGAGFTRRLEAAYRRMWRDWCAGRGAPAA